MEVDFFSKNVVNFIKKLDTITYAKVLKEIELIKAFGNQVGMPYSKKIGRSLYELRTKGSTEIRLFYTFYKNKAVILHGIVKKSNKIPNKDIRLAKKYLKELD